MRYSRKSAGILSLLLLFNSIGMTACGQATAETGHVSISMTGMENTPVINYTVPTLTPNVLVDQQGYAAVGEKQAVVKGRQSVETFRLVDRETGETVYEGTVKQHISHFCSLTQVKFQKEAWVWEKRRQRSLRGKIF